MKNTNLPQLLQSLDRQHSQFQQQQHLVALMAIVFLYVSIHIFWLCLPIFSPIHRMLQISWFLSSYDPFWRKNHLNPPYLSIINLSALSLFARNKKKYTKFSSIDFRYVSAVRFPCNASVNFEVFFFFLSLHSPPSCIECILNYTWTPITKSNQSNIYELLSKFTNMIKM